MTRSPIELFWTAKNSKKNKTVPILLAPTNSQKYQKNDKMRRNGQNCKIAKKTHFVTYGRKIEKC